MDDFEKLYNHINDWALAIAPDSRTEESERSKRKIVYDTLQTVLDLMTDGMRRRVIEEENNG